MFSCGNAIITWAVEEEEEERRMRESQHPKGALVFMLVYLLTLTVLWLNAYMRLWSE
jgi:hypothetical protein